MNRSAPTPAPITRSGFGHAVAAEWTKLVSLTSTAWSLAATMIIMVGSAFLTARALPGFQPAETYPPADVITAALQGVVFGQLAVCVLGSMVITSEYGTGAIRSSLVVVPVRGRLLAAKAAVVTALALVVGAAGAVASFVVVRLLLSDRATHVGLDDPGVFRALAGCALYLATLSCLALAVGVVVRHSAIAISTLAAGVLIVPMVLTQLGDAGRTALRWWPTEAGIQLLRIEPTGLAPWPGCAVLATTTAVLLAIAYLLLKRRDA
ncbi:ABC transporter permease [Micromonospora sp. HM5-17]|jgi:hypothetical protein|uniref:ABC transporter permease n=1 Tax=Micromonospora sp. HM5-17 TaxID=2487710 RepID=UPI000F470599|nr:ABC transporter permease [Micromonospora sp. HM5-17]ROT26067.1 ABC transporter permease [Micromonospora sp. HM5-17]